MADEMGALGELICRLNPYTKRKNDPVTGLKETGGMQMQPPHAKAPAAVEKASPAEVRALNAIIRNIPVEVVRNYAEKWTFKGQTFAVKSAVRIPYSFEVTTGDDETYWQTENLLIGFAGNDGPG